MNPPHPPDNSASSALIDHCPSSLAYGTGGHRFKEPWYTCIARGDNYRDYNSNRIGGV